jgi:hemerythrin-like metal-binding protein
LSEDGEAPVMLLEWREQYALGIPAVDHEHRELIGLINETYARSRQRGAAHGLTADSLGELLSRISAHFALEERFMREAGYDEYAAHKADHEGLLDQLRDIMEAVEADGYPAGELGRDLDGWFTVHFRTHDARLHRRLHP